VRLFKTRSAANTAVKGGKIKVDGEPVKPSHKLRVGQTVMFRQPGRERIIEVTDSSKSASATRWPSSTTLTTRPSRSLAISWLCPDARAAPDAPPKKNV